MYSHSGHSYHNSTHKSEDMSDKEICEGMVTQTGSVTNLDRPAIIGNGNMKKKTKDVEADHLVANAPIDHEAIEYIDQELATIISPKESTNVCGCTPDRFKIIAGLFIVLFIALSWTGSTQFAKSTYSTHFHAPYFVTWYNTCFMIIIYPVFMLPLICKKSPWRMRTFLRQSGLIFGPRGFCLKSLVDYLLKCIIPFCLLWLITNYLYIRSLRNLLPGTVTAIFSSSSCFVYILSLVFLRDKFYLIRMTAVCLSIGGIVMMGYSEGFDASSATSIIFVVLAAFGGALYQVLFKRAMGSASGIQVALFLTLLGLVNAILFCPILFLMEYLKWESITWKDIPWVNLNGTAILTMVFNYLVNFGISVTFPLFISLGTMVGMPLSAGVDSVFRGKGFGEFKIISAFMILGGFMLLLIPDDTLSRYERKLRCLSNEVSSGDEKVVENGNNSETTVAEIVANQRLT